MMMMRRASILGLGSPTHQSTEAAPHMASAASRHLTPGCVCWNPMGANERAICRPAAEGEEARRSLNSPRMGGDRTLPSSSFPPHGGCILINMLSFSHLTVKR